MMKNMIKFFRDMILLRTKDMVLKNILRLCTDLVRVRFIDVVFLKIFYKRMEK